MKIEQLNVSKNCLRQLKGSGYTEIEEFIYFLENVAGNATVTMRIDAKCLEQVMNQLEILGLWPKDESNP